MGRRLPRLRWSGRRGVGVHSLITTPLATTNWGWRTAGFFLLFPGAVVVMKPGIPGPARLLAALGMVGGLTIFGRERWPQSIRRLGRPIPVLAALYLLLLNAVSDGRALQLWELVLWYAAGLTWIGLTQATSALWLAPVFVVTFMLSAPGLRVTDTVFPALLTMAVMTSTAYLVALDLARGRRAYARMRQWGRYMTAVAQTGKVTPGQRPSEIHHATAQTAVDLGFTGAGIAQVMPSRKKWEWRVWIGVGLGEPVEQDLPPHLFAMVPRSGVHRAHVSSANLVLLRVFTGDEMTYVLVAHSTGPDDDEQLQALELLAAQASRALEILQMAYYDRLTRLPNRALFQDRLTENVGQVQQHADYSFALLYLDVDRFKAINDLYGHGVGDLFLQDLAERLRSCLRGLDYISHKGNPSSSRLGGDEFAVLLPGVSRQADASLVAERIHSRLSRPFHVDGRDVVTCPSIGVVLSDARYTAASEMMRDADTAMYYAKGSEHRRWAVFDDAMRVSTDRALELERSLGQALSQQQISLRYQPIAVSGTGRLVGFEALLRWRHPTLGAIPPREFIPLAEKTGIIGELTSWVFEQTIGQLAAWNTQVVHDPPIYVAVNLSRKEIGNASLLARLRSLLDTHRVAPEQVVVEITERMALVDPEQTQAYLRELRALGVRLALDDFGTGYSSLSCLHELPVQILKLDHRFIAAAKAEKRALRSLDGFVRMAHAMDLEVVAEGIEEAGQRDVMHQFKCDLVQGYFIAPPLEAAEATDWLAAHEDPARGTTPRAPSAPGAS